jgi:hypothetical protein
MVQRIPSGNEPRETLETTGGTLSDIHLQEIF